MSFSAEDILSRGLGQYVAELWFQEIISEQGVRGEGLVQGSCVSESLAERVMF